MRGLGVFLLGVSLAFQGCGPAGPGGGADAGLDSVGSAAGFTLSVSGGLFESGAQRGLALLATLRDSTGRGPGSPWSLTVLSPSATEIASVTYDDGSDGSFMVWWWDSVEPEEGRYSVIAKGEQTSITVRFQVRNWAGLAPPGPSLAADGASLSWSPVDGAASYSCRIFAGSVLVTSTAPSSRTTCDVSALSDGSYSATVFALSLDVAGLSSDRSAAPALPPSFNVASGAIAFSKGGNTPGFQLAAAAGPLSFGPATPGLAVWTALAESSGTPPAEDWALTIIGPGLSPSAPLAANYPKGTSKQMLFFYDSPARSGSYTLTAQAGDKRLVSSFSVGDGASLPIANGLSASSKGSGGVDVSWAPVASAKSYRVSLWLSGAGAAVPTAAIWVQGSSASFPNGTCSAGSSYDVYVDSTDVDMTLESAFPGPASVAVSENAYTPFTFTAR